MTDTEAREVYVWLVELLDGSGLGEVVQTVEAYLRLGKAEEREVALYEEPRGLRDSEPSAEPYGVRRRRGPRSKYFGVSEYSALERLRILIDAFLHRLVYAHLVEYAAWEHLDLEHAGVENAIRLEQIALASELEGEEPVAQSLRRDLPIQQLHTLREKLEGLRDEVRP